MAHILILSGPNLNMLGRREPGLYGTATLSEIEEMCRDKAGTYGLKIDFRQSNDEGEMVTWIQDALDDAQGIIINAGAYTHTSLAIHDALKLHSVPVVEVHLTNPKEREDFRHFSYIEPLAALTIAGEGAPGYARAVEEMAGMLGKI